MDLIDKILFIVGTFMTVIGGIILLFNEISGIALFINGLVIGIILPDFKETNKGTESDCDFMTCVGCGTTENVNEVGLCSFCEEDRELADESLFLSEEALDKEENDDEL